VQNSGNRLPGISFKDLNMPLPSSERNISSALKLQNTKIEAPIIFLQIQGEKRKEKRVES